MKLDGVAPLIADLSDAIPLIGKMAVTFEPMMQF